MKSRKNQTRNRKTKYIEYLEGKLKLSVYVKIKYPHEFNYDNISLISFFKKGGIDTLKQLAENKHYLDTIQITDCNITKLNTF